MDRYTVSLDNPNQADTSTRQEDLSFTRTNRTPTTISNLFYPNQFVWNINVNFEDQLNQVMYPFTPFQGDWFPHKFFQLNIEL